MFPTRHRVAEDMPNMTLSPRSGPRDHFVTTHGSRCGETPQPPLTHTRHHTNIACQHNIPRLPLFVPRLPRLVPRGTLVDPHIHTRIHIHTHIHIHRGGRLLRGALSGAAYSGEGLLGEALGARQLLAMPLVDVHQWPPAG